MTQIPCEVFGVSASKRPCAVSLFFCIMKLMLRDVRVGGGVGMMTFLELAHVVDATQLCLFCHCTHGGCCATS